MQTLLPVTSYLLPAFPAMLLSVHQSSQRSFNTRGSPLSDSSTSSHVLAAQVSRMEADPTWDSSSAANAPMYQHPRYVTVSLHRNSHAKLTTFL